MSIARYLREIGRGREGAGSLSRDDARDLMAQVLDRSVTDLEIGAFALAMRIKGESVDELTGFLDAAHERCLAVRSSRPTIVLPSYNGSRRIANLTALLALLLAKRGVQVLVHGPTQDTARVTTAEIFGELGLTGARDAGEIADAWSRGEPAFVDIAVLCPPLALLLEVRKVVGLRNPGHTIAKLLVACGGGEAMRVVNHTHPEYGTRLAEFLAETRADALLMRGTEGEPVADARRLQRLDVYLGGRLRDDLSLPGQAGAVTSLPELPQGSDAAATASYIRAVVGGAMPVPMPVMAQVDLLMRALAAIGPAAADAPA